MSKNLIPQIAQMLGVEPGEKFKVKGYNELTCMITNDKGVMARDGSRAKSSNCRGDLIIVKCIGLLA